MLGTIRGIVEIEQAESDRALEKRLRKKEEEDKKRENRRGLLIALVGTGLTVTGISTQSPGKLEQVIIKQIKPNQSFNCPKAGLNPCLIYSGVYVVFHVGVGAIAASVLGLIIWLISTITE